MTGLDLQGAAEAGRLQAVAMDAALGELQARIPANTTLGSAAFVSGALAALGFGRAYQLSARCSNLRTVASNIQSGFQTLVDAGGATGSNAPSQALAEALYGRQVMLQSLTAEVSALAVEVNQLANVADLAELPASLAVDAGENAVDAAGNALDTAGSILSFWSRYGTYIILGALAFGVWLFVWGPGKALIANYTGGRK